VLPVVPVNFVVRQLPRTKVLVLLPHFFVDKDQVTLGNLSEEIAMIADIEKPKVESFNEL
jgi:hypothetical protein